MTIKKLLIKNYKLLKNLEIPFNPDINIFVGDNDAGKSTILEVLSILTTGKLNSFAFDRQLKANLFNIEVREQYIRDVEADLKPEPPRIILEAYFDSAEYKGTENELSEDTSGIRVVVDILDTNTETYKKMLQLREIKDIPIELYGVSYYYFSGNQVSFRLSPFKSVFIDTTRKGYIGVVDSFVSDSLSDNLSDDELIDLSIAYNASRRQFHEHNAVKKLNDTVRESGVIKGKTISIDLREDDMNAWKRQMSMVVDDIPFENMGFGTQNIIKIELALRNAENQSNIVLIEEPENHLAFSNMCHLIKHIVQSEGKQVFISTHSSYVANKLDIGNVILVKNGSVCRYSDLSDETKNYFSKLPGYDTLRFVLSAKVILVEGPTDDLIIQRAYRDKYGHLPSDDGIDIIAVRSLSFKRFADIANLINKEIAIVTDNDGNIEENIKEKYSDYLGCDNIHFFYETDEKLNTIENSVLAANCNSGEPTESFKEVISKNRSLESRDYKGILKYMKGNKAEWAFRVFDADEPINYPQYIKDVINHF